ncbi:MAG: 1-acyl-sn-glycerol-3-phosphate acyltransferase [Chloroflexi bacterium]|nr:1-acyl-sn-glycerol-3-phosphate acyltransferase [Chloroflexota bacterium]
MNNLARAAKVIMLDTPTTNSSDLEIQSGTAARARWQLRVFRWFVRVIFLSLFRVRIVGIENALRAPCIICFNHLGWTEGFLVLLFFPVEPRIYGLGERQVAHRSALRHRLLNWLQIFIPLDRDKPREALRIMADVLNRGGSLALAPEGKLGEREGVISELQNGAAYICLHTGAPIVPVGVTGSLELWWRCKLTMRVGKPIAPKEFTGDSRTRVRALTARMDRDLRALLPGDVEHARVKLFRDRLTKLL